MPRARPSGWRFRWPTGWRPCARSAGAGRIAAGDTSPLDLRAMIAAIVAAFHYLALALGLPSVFLRGRALKGPLDRDGLRRLFAADSIWGVAAGLWLVTGLLRAFGGLEKGSAFYLASRLFWLKLALFALVVGLEVWPMVTLIRWRRA